MNKQQEIARFLSYPPEGEALEQFCDNDELLVWIDWREYEEDLIKWFNEYLAEADQIVCKTKEIDKPRGVDIVLTSKEKSMTIPFADDATDRDSAIRAMQEMIAPNYQIRWFMESLGGDTLAFVLLPTAQWTELERQFGKEKVEFYFQPVTSDSVMFQMEMDEVFAKIDIRAKERPSQ